MWPNINRLEGFLKLTKVWKGIIYNKEDHKRVYLKKPIFPITQSYDIN